MEVRPRMPFTITKKKQSYSSNKTKTLLENGEVKLPDEQFLASHPTPIIDRLTVTITIHDPEEALGYFACHSACAEQPSFRPAIRSKGYSRAYRIALPSIADATKWPFYEFRCGEQGVTRVRLDLIPADLGKDGLAELNDELWKLFYGGWEYFYHRGRVSRIDIAVDFPQLEMDQIFLLPQQGLTTKQFSSSGRLETVYLGKSKGNYTAIYNRKAKRIAQKKPWKGKAGIRVERRLKNQKLWLKDIDNLACPFANLQGISRQLDRPKFEKKAYFWEYFKDSLSARGLPAALALLPQGKRTQYRKYLKTKAPSLWDFDEIWSRWKVPASALRPIDETGFF